MTRPRSQALAQTIALVCIAVAPAAAPSADTKFCIDCGKPIAARAKFCSECGQPQ